MLKLLILFIIVHLFTPCLSADDITLNGQECDDDSITEKPCSCYSVLENSLLKKEKNRVNLKKAFFPPVDNIPACVCDCYI